VKRSREKEIADNKTK